MSNFNLTNYLSKNRLVEAIELTRLYPEDPDEVAQKVADHFTKTDNLDLIYSIKPGSLKMTSKGAYFDLNTEAGPNTPGEDFKDENGFGIENYLGDYAGGSFVIKSEEGLDEDFFVIRNMANRNAKVGMVNPEGEVTFTTETEMNEMEDLKLNNSKMETEKIIKTYNIGKDSRLVFGGDNKTYYVKSITPDRESVFVTIDGSTTFKKPLSKVTKVDGKEIVLEMKLNKMKIGDKVNYDGEKNLIVNILKDGSPVLVPMSSIDDEAFSVDSDEISNPKLYFKVNYDGEKHLVVNILDDGSPVLVPMSVIDDEAFSIDSDEIETPMTENVTTKMKKSELKEMIRQNVLNELTTDIKEDTDVEFGDPDGELAPLYADFYEGLEEAEEEVEDVEKVDVKIDEPEIDEPTLTDAEIETQSLLNQALAASQEMGNEKLTQQIGNTIKFFTRDVVVKEADEIEEGKKEYYKDAEADDAEHIDALEKDMKDDKKSSMNEDMFPLFKKIIK